MLLNCPHCFQGIEESATYDIDKLHPKSLLACPHCHTELVVTLSPVVQPWLSRNLLLKLQVVCIIAISIGEFWGINSVTYSALVSLGAVPIIAGCRDFLAKKRASLIFSM